MTNSYRNATSRAFGPLKRQKDGMELRTFGRADTRATVVPDLAGRLGGNDGEFFADDDS